MKIAITKNKNILKFFPGITLAKDSEGDTEFVHPDGFTTKVLCRGVDQLGATRGVKFGDYRPDLIIGDDMEDDELVRSPERRIQLQSDFDDALIPTGDRTTQYIFIGTILHDDALLAKLVSKDNYSEYHKLLYRARNEEGGVPTSLWPEKWTVDQLNKMEKDKPSTFAKEMQNDPVSGKQARFHREDFRYWTMENRQYILTNQEGDIVSRGHMMDCKSAIACDLAWSERRDADSTVIMPMFMTPSGELLIDTYIAQKGMRPDKFAEYLFMMEARLRDITGSSVPIGFEKAMLEKVTQWVLKQEMRKRGQWLITKELKWETDKITRIETVLQPRYANHIIHHKKGMGDLEQELLRFPSGSHDDIVDSLQSVCRLLEYPKNKKEATPVDTDFEFWRKLAIDSKRPKRGMPYVFGNKTKHVIGIPHQIGPVTR